MVSSVPVLTPRHSASYQGPIQLHMLSAPNLLARLPNHLMRQQIERPNLILMSITVEMSPHASLGLAFDFGKLIESWEGEVRLARQSGRHC